MRKGFYPHRVANARLTASTATAVASAHMMGMVTASILSARRWGNDPYLLILLSLCPWLQATAADSLFHGIARHTSGDPSAWSTRSRNWSVMFR
jgi:hypothetical protein